MGYDVTFHPIARSELERYVLEVLAAPGLADDRAAEITDAPDKRFALRRIYEAMCATVSEQKDDVSPHPSRLAALQFWAAQIAGYLHPYWYARNAAIGFLQDPDVRALFAPVSPGGGPTLTWIGSVPESAPLTGNYAGSGFVEDVAALEAALLPALDSLDGDAKARRSEPLLRDDALGAVHDALAYCREHGLGLIEASDVVVPIPDEWSTDPDHLTDAEWRDGEDSSDGLLRFARSAEGPQNTPLEDYIHGRIFLPGDSVAVHGLIGTKKHCTIAVKQVVVASNGVPESLPDHRRMVVFPGGMAKPVHVKKLRLEGRCLSHASHWIERYEEELEFWAEQAMEDLTGHIDAAGPFAYGGIVQDRFEDGLQMVYARQADLAEALFDSTLRAGEYILEKKLTDEDIHRYWRQRADIALVSQLARVLRRRDRQDSPDPDVLRGALRDFAKDLDGVSRSRWNELDEKVHSDAIAVALLVEDFDTALTLLNRNRPADTQADTRRVFQRCATRQRLCAGDETFVARCRRYLELLRAPTGGLLTLAVKPFAVPLYAAVLDTYVFRPGETIDWPAMVEELGR